MEEFTKENLWLILVEPVHEAVMSPSHKAYIRDVIWRGNPDVTPTELTNRLNMPIGEAIVILDELAEERKSPT